MCAATEDSLQLVDEFEDADRYLEESSSRVRSETLTTTINDCKTHLTLCQQTWEIFLSSHQAVLSDIEENIAIDGDPRSSGLAEDVAEKRRKVEDLPEHPDQDVAVESLERLEERADTLENIEAFLDDTAELAKELPRRNARKVARALTQLLEGLQDPASLTDVIYILAKGVIPNIISLPVDPITTVEGYTELTGERKIDHADDVLYRLERFLYTSQLWCRQTQVLVAIRREGGMGEVRDDFDALVNESVERVRERRKRILSTSPSSE